MNADEMTFAFGADADNPVWPLNCYRPSGDYPHKVSQKVSRFFEVLSRNVPIGYLFGKSLRLPLFVWLDTNGVNTVRLVPCDRSVQNYEGTFPLEIVVNDFTGTVVDKIADVLDMERRWSSVAPVLDENVVLKDVNEGLEIFIASDEVEAAAEYLPEFLTARLYEREPVVAPIQFVRTNLNLDGSFTTPRAKELLI